MPTSFNPLQCPLCSSEDLKTLNLALGLFRCRECGEMFDDEEDDLDEPLPHKSRPRRSGYDDFLDDD